MDHRRSTHRDHHGDRLQVTHQPYTFSPLYCLVMCWLVAIVGVIPHTIFIEYIDLGDLLGTPFAGTGVCVVNLQEGNVEEYIRILFLLFYLVPIVSSISYHCRAIDVIKNWTRSLNQDNERRSIISTTHRDSILQYYRSSSVVSRSGGSTGGDNGDNGDFDSNMLIEQGFQNMLAIAFAIHSISLLPLIALRYVFDWLQ